MTTGAPLFLVSACASAEEFVAAFRRYADRTGLFIPMAEPLPAGRTGRIALTLSDGGVMIEGVAQVVTSSAKPVGLYGRPGITVKFTEPDEPSKTVIAELEKARLALRPLAPSVPPRKAEVPKEPRPKPPPILGRIDAANALAETIAIGDLSALEATAGDPSASGSLPKAGQKFVVPSIPAIGGASPGSGPIRAKTPSTPPVAERAKTPTKPPIAAPIASGTALADALKAAPASAENSPDAPPKAPEPAKPAKPPPTPAIAKSKKPTMIGMPAVDRLPIEKLTATTDLKMTTRGVGPGKGVFVTQPLPLAQAVKQVADAPKDAAMIADKPPPREDPTTPLVMKRPDGVKPGLPPRRANTPSTPPMPRQPTPAAPLPVARLPAHGAPAISSDAVDVQTESTDVTTVPEPALPPADAAEIDTAKSDAIPEAKPLRSGGMRASEIMAAIPTEDWTMSPDASAPVVLPASAKLPSPEDEKLVVEAKTPPKGPPTGDWTMSADPQAPDGWAAPAKVAKHVERPPDVPAATGKPATGNPVHSIASDKALVIQEWEDKPTGIGVPLVEIDSTLMEPLTPMPSVDSLPEGPRPAASAPAMAAAPMLAPTQQPQAGFDHVGTPPPLAPPPLALPTPIPMMGPPTPSPGMVMNPGFRGPMPNATGPQQAFPPAQNMTSFPRPMNDAGTGFFGDSEPVNYGSDRLDAENQRRKKVLLIAVGSAVAAVALVVVIIMATGGKKTAASTRMKPTAGSTVGSAMVVQTPTPTPTPAPPPTPTPEVTPTPPVPGTCKVEVTTTPPGAQVNLDKETHALGMTPGTFDLPCDAEAKLKIYKSHYFGVIKTITPTAEGTKIDIALASAMFAVKVTSAPAGATITIGGKPMGVTPTSIHLPAFAASTIVITKDGFTPDTQKITPKQNGMAHHVTLKKLSVQRPKH